MLTMFEMEVGAVKSFLAETSSPAPRGADQVGVLLARVRARSALYFKRRMIAPS